MGPFRAFTLSPSSFCKHAPSHILCRRALTGELGRISLQKDELLKGLFKDSAEAAKNKQHDEFRGSQEYLQKQEELFIFNYRSDALMRKKTLFPITRYSSLS